MTRDAAAPEKERGLKAFRAPVYAFMEPLTRLLVRLGVHPNLISGAGLATAIIGGVLFAQGAPRWAGFVFLASGFLDILDGRVARAAGLDSTFGSYLDSTLDRICEIAMYLGLLSAYVVTGPAYDPWMAYAVLLTLGGSLMVSYARAKAEALGYDCAVGLMQRAERIAILGLGAILFGVGGPFKIVLAIVAVLTCYTALYRIFWVYRAARRRPTAKRPSS